MDRMAQFQIKILIFESNFRLMALFQLSHDLFRYDFIVLFDLSVLKKFIFESFIIGQHI